MPEKVPTFRPKLHAQSQRAATRSYERRAPRLEDKRFYASSRWRALRSAYLQEHPLCEDHQARGQVVAAEHVHHKIERKDAPELALDWANLRALCKPCHSTYSRFGRPPGGVDLLPSRRG